MNEKTPTPNKTSSIILYNFFKKKSAEKKIMGAVNGERYFVGTFEHRAAQRHLSGQSFATSSLHGNGSVAEKLQLVL